MNKDTAIDVSGKRFSVVYSLFGDEEFAHQRADEIIVEQTIEYPADLVTDSFILDHVIGHIEEFIKVSDQHFSIRVSYLIEETGFMLPQFLNVVYGNISLKTGIQVERLEIPEELLGYFRGPRFGVKGIRELLGVPKRPLLGSAIKPMGLPNSDLAKMAYDYALGGLDIIKDDHSLNDLPYSNFKDRVARCVDAVQSANAKTGATALYFPCIVAPFEKILEYAYYAKEAGAGGFLAVPGLTGLDSMRMLADQDDLNLPILYHPAFHGSYFMGSENGFSKYAFFGQITRLAGADASIFANFGGRFTFTRTECEEIVEGCKTKMGYLKPIFPAPAGGMTFNMLSEMKNVYDRDVLYIMGGGLHRGGSNLVANCRKFREIVEKL